MRALILRLLQYLAWLPLIIFQLVGVVLGRVSLSIDSTYARRIAEHLQSSGIASNATHAKKLARQVAAEAGKSIVELVVIWFRSEAGVAKLVRKVEGWEHVEAVYSQGQGFIILTPHLGCFELVGLYCGMHYPFTIFYRPPQLAWLEPVLRAGRRRAQIKLAPTTKGGIKLLLKTLQRGEAIGLLPDQVPGSGEGVWADFFGRPAYTMTLAWKLAVRTKAPVVFASAMRLPRGQGYHLFFEPFVFPPELDAEAAATLLNQELEKLILRCPMQYLWSYNRYKIPRGANAHQEHNQPL